MNLIPILLGLLFIITLALVCMKPSTATGIVFGFFAGLTAAYLLMMAFLFILGGGRL